MKRENEISETIKELEKVLSDGCPIDRVHCQNCYFWRGRCDYDRVIVAKGLVNIGVKE